MRNMPRHRCRRESRPHLHSQNAGWRGEPNELDGCSRLYHHCSLGFGLLVTTSRIYCRIYTGVQVLVCCSANPRASHYIHCTRPRTFVSRFSSIIALQPAREVREAIYTYASRYILRRCKLNTQSACTVRPSIYPSLNHSSKRPCPPNVSRHSHCARVLAVDVKCIAIYHFD